MSETFYVVDGTRAVDKISKTKRKQQMHELQDIGEELVELSKEALSKIPMSEDLLDAIKEYKRLNAHEAPAAKCSSSAKSCAKKTPRRFAKSSNKSEAHPPPRPHCFTASNATAPQ